MEWQVYFSCKSKINGILKIKILLENLKHSELDAFSNKMKFNLFKHIQIQQYMFPKENCHNRKLDFCHQQ